MRTCLVTLLLLGLLALQGAAAVLLVDGVGGSPGRFATLQGAVDASAAGDTLLIVAGADTSGEELVVDGKGIAILRDLGASDPAGQLAGLTVRNVPAGQEFVLHELKVTNPPAGVAATLEDNAGVLRLYALRVTGRQGEAGTRSSPGRPGWPGLVIDACADVRLMGFNLAGGAGGDLFAPPEETLATDGGPGVLMTDSTVTFFSGLVRGGFGGLDIAPTAHDGTHGGTALVNDGGDVFFQGTSLLGGDGRHGTGDGVGGDGGAALIQTGPGARVRSIRADFEGGDAGTGPGGDGTPGAPQIIEAGTVVSLPETMATTVGLTNTYVVREGEAAQATVWGPGQLLFLVIGAFPGNFVLPAHEGVLALTPPVFGPIFTGVVTSFPGITINLGTAPDLPPGAETAELQFQCVVSEPLGGYVLSKPGHVVVVEAGL